MMELIILSQFRHLLTLLFGKVKNILDCIRFLPIFFTSRFSQKICLSNMCLPALVYPGGTLKLLINPFLAASS